MMLIEPKDPTVTRASGRRRNCLLLIDAPSCENEACTTIERSCSWPPKWGRSCPGHYHTVFSCQRGLQTAHKLRHLIGSYCTLSLLFLSYASSGPEKDVFASRDETVKRCTSPVRGSGFKPRYARPLSGNKHRMWPEVAASIGHAVLTYLPTYAIYQYWYRRGYIRATDQIYAYW